MLYYVSGPRTLNIKINLDKKQYIIDELIRSEKGPSKKRLGLILSIEKGKENFSWLQPFHISNKINISYVFRKVKDIKMDWKGASPTTGGKHPMT